MDIKPLRQFIQDQAGGVVIRMVDGTEYRLPHFDFAWFTPSTAKPGTRYASAFRLHDPDKDGTRLVNAMLVKEVAPLASNGSGACRPRSGGNGRGKRSPEKGDGGDE